MSDQLAKLWNALNGTQRRSIILLGVVTLAALGGVIVWSMRISYGLLYSNLPVEEAGAIVEYLRSNNIGYRLAGGGRTIEVDRAHIYELRL